MYDTDTMYYSSHIDNTAYVVMHRKKTTSKTKMKKKEVSVREEADKIVVDEPRPSTSRILIEERVSQGKNEKGKKTGGRSRSKTNYKFFS